MRTLGVLCLLATGCHHTQPATTPTSPLEDPNDPLRFMPAASEVILEVDLVQLRTSPLWPAIAPRITAYASRILEPFERTCGFDPIASATTLTLGLDHLALDRPDAILVVRGIQRDRLVECAKQAAAAGIAVRVDDNGASVPGAVAAVFIEPTLAVIQIGPNATPESLQRVIANGAPLRATPPPVQTSGAAWLVAQGNAHILATADVAGKPRLVTGSLRVLGDLSLTARIQFSAADAAEAFAKHARDQLALSSGLLELSTVTVSGNDALIELVATYPDASRMIEATVPMPPPAAKPAEAKPAEATTPAPAKPAKVTTPVPASSVPAKS